MVVRSITSGRWVGGMVLGWLLGTGGAALGQSTVFTYQGKLEENGQALTGSYDVRALVFQLTSGGTPLGEYCSDAITVDRGLFTVQLDPGVAIDENSHYLEVQVRPHVVGRTCADLTGFTTLTPRTLLARAPYATHAVYASRLSAGDGSPLNAGTVDFDGNLLLSYNAVVGGRLGVGTTVPSNRMELVTGSGAFLSFTEPDGDLRFNGGSDGVMRFMNTTPGARTEFLVNGLSSMRVHQGAVSIGHNGGTPTRTLSVAGDMEIGTGSADYRNLRLGGGNSSGFLYGSYPVLGDGIHLGYNWYADSSAIGFVVNPGGGTSRISAGYGFVALATGAINGIPVDRLTVLINGNVGVGTTSPASLFHVNGNIRCVSLTQTSSATLKDDVTPMADAMGSVARLKPVAFVWNERAPREARGKRDVGLLAEDVAGVLPEAVALDSDGAPAGIDYSRITVLAVRAIQELEARRARDAAEIGALRERLATLEHALGEPRARGGPGR